MLWILAGLLFFVKIGETQPSDTIRTTYLCPNGFHSVGEKCYHFGNNEVPWLDSHFYCQLLNSSLAAVNSYREQHLLRDFVAGNAQAALNKEYWIDGIYDWKQNRWKWGSSGESIHFNVFVKRNVGDENKWNCITLNAARKLRWTAKKCTEKKHFLCETDTNIFVQFAVRKKKKIDISKCNSGQKLDRYEKKKCMKLLGADPSRNEPAQYAFRPKPTRATPNHFDAWICPPYMIGLGNKCYYFSQTETTWTDAHFECRKNKTKLAIIRNKPQDHNLRRFLNNFIEKQDRWIDGIYDWKSGQWKWAITGQPLTYKGFAVGVIKSMNSQELAWTSIFMDPKIDNQWNIAEQTGKKRFICQVKAKAVKNLGKVRLRPPQATIQILTS